MGDIRELLERHQLDSLLPEASQNQNLAAQANSGHWWNRLFPSRQDEPPPPPPPPPPKMPSPWEMLKPDGGEWKRTGLWDPSMAEALNSSPIGVISYADRHGKKQTAKVTVGNLPNILFNEYSALQGSDPKQGYAGDEKLKEGKTATAHAILNDLSYRPDSIVASPFISNQRRQQKDFQNFREYQDIAGNALADHMILSDPVQGRGNYNLRDTPSIGARIVNGRRDPKQTLYRQYGPFVNANTGGKGWIDF